MNGKSEQSLMRFWLWLGKGIEKYNRNAALAHLKREKAKLVEKRKVQDVMIVVDEMST